MPEDEINAMIELMNRVSAKLTDDSDVVWTGFRTVQELRGEIDNAVLGLREDTKANLFRLYLLFAPAGSLQDHSIDNGWADEFIRLSIEFDELYAAINSRIAQ
ncbi:MAG: hypothetical protein LBO63_02285 [Oscillospiraceae bacterium]|jgi:hypothetical protein|nr:hypothetical protein [Oscillospiraceae bacterium]